MKNILKTICILALVLSSCTNDNIESATELDFTAKQNELNFKIDSKENIEYSSNLNNGKATSSLSFESNNVAYNLVYNIDVNIEHWKLKQSDNVILQSEALVAQKINSQTLVDLTNSLEKFYTDNYNTISQSSDPLLLSMLNYYKSIFNVANTAILSNSDCECTVHPAFLLEKTNFNCQEEQYINVNDLKKVFESYKSEGNIIDSSTKNLISFLGTTNQAEIRFDDYYSYYVNEKDYQLTLSNFISPQNINSQEDGDCGWYCVLGCGSDHGCCGNYSGCCLYWNVNCYVHDKLCTNCEPAWFCLPGCKPDLAIVDAP